MMAAHCEMREMLLFEALDVITGTNGTSFFVFLFGGGV